MGKAEKDYRADPSPGAGPYMGLALAERKLQIRFQAWCTARLADNECEHGRLPGDRKIECKCWGWPAPTYAYLRGTVV